MARAGMESSIRLLIVEAQALVREAFRILLQSQSELEVVSATGVIEESISAAKAKQPDVILLNLDFVGEASCRTISRLREAAPQARILVMAGTSDDERHQEVIRQGAMGVVKQYEAAEVLLQAIRKVNSGEVWIDSGLMTRLMSSIWGNGSAQPRPQPDVEKTFTNQISGPNALAKQTMAEPVGVDFTKKLGQQTGREKEVVVLIAEGMRNRQIADKLFISPITVRHHLTSIFSKLELNNRFELAVFAFRCGLANVPGKQKAAHK